MSGVVEESASPATFPIGARDPAIRYSPEGWTFSRNSSVSHRPGSSVTLQFRGSKIRWVGTADPRAATYMVDDVVSKSFPDSRPSFPSTYHILFETPNLPFGSHNLTVVLHREGSSLSLSQLVIQNGSTIVDGLPQVAGSVDDMQPLYRRSQASSDRMSTTAVLAGVFGSFGFFLLVGGIFLFIRRRRLQRAHRTLGRRTEAKQGVAIGELPPSSRRAKVASPSSPPRASQKSKERRGTKSPNRARQHEPTSQPPRPKERGGTDSPTRARQREPASQSPRPVEASSPSRPIELRGHETSHRSPETPTTPGKDVSTDPRSQPLVAPNPQRFRDHDTQEEPRAETPVPLHPPLRFSPAPARSSGSSSPSLTPANILPSAVSRRQERRHISGLMGDSDTEYLSDASANSRATLMPAIGASRRTGSLQAAPPRPQPQQQVVLDLPPAYTPE